MCIGNGNVYTLKMLNLDSPMADLSSVVPKDPGSTLTHPRSIRTNTNFQGI